MIETSLQSAVGERSGGGLQTAGETTSTVTSSPCSLPNSITARAVVASLALRSCRVPPFTNLCAQIFDTFETLVGGRDSIMDAVFPSWRYAPVHHSVGIILCVSDRADRSLGRNSPLTHSLTPALANIVTRTGKHGGWDILNQPTLNTHLPLSSFTLHLIDVVSCLAFLHLQQTRYSPTVRGSPGDFCTLEFHPLSKYQHDSPALSTAASLGDIQPSHPLALSSID